MLHHYRGRGDDLNNKVTAVAQNWIIWLEVEIEKLCKSRLVLTSNCSFLFEKNFQFVIMFSLYCFEILLIKYSSIKRRQFLWTGEAVVKIVLAWHFMIFIWYYRSDPQWLATGLTWHWSWTEWKPHKLVGSILLVRFPNQLGNLFGYLVYTRSTITAQTHYKSSWRS